MDTVCGTSKAPLPDPSLLTMNWYKLIPWKRMINTRKVCLFQLNLAQGHIGSSACAAAVGNELQVLSTSLQTNQLLTDSQPCLIGLRGAICGPRLCTLDLRLNKHHTHTHTHTHTHSIACPKCSLPAQTFVMSKCTNTHTLIHNRQWTPELDLKAGCGPLLITARPALVLLER